MLLLTYLLAPALLLPTSLPPAHTTRAAEPRVRAAAPRLTLPLEVDLPRLLEVWEGFEAETGKGRRVTPPQDDTKMRRLVRAQIHATAVKANVSAPLARLVLFQQGRLPAESAAAREARKDQEMLDMLQTPRPGEESATGSLRMIGAAMGVSHECVRQRLDALASPGIMRCFRRNTRAKHRRIRNEQVISAFNESATGDVDKIADATGVSRDLVNAIVVKAGMGHRRLPRSRTINGPRVFTDEDIFVMLRQAAEGLPRLSTQQYERHVKQHNARLAEAEAAAGGAPGAGAGAGAGAAGVVLAVEAVDGRLFSFATHAPGANLALVLLPVLLVPATHAGQNQSRRPT